MTVSTPTLTNREQEVFNLVIQAKTDVEIGEALCRHRKTIEKHVSSILKKWKVKNRKELIVEYFKFLQ